MERTLYHLEACPHCEKVRLALGVLGLPWSSIEVGDDRSEVERVSGQSAVPVLVEDGTAIHDSMRILEHLAATPGATLFPEGRRARSLTRVLIEHADGAIAALSRALRRRVGPDGETLSDDDLAAVRRRLVHELELLDGTLEGSPFLFGEIVTVADLVYHAYLSRLDARGELDVPDDLVRVRGWYDRVRDRAGG